jgi:cell division septal protein FtsQ
MKEKELLKSKKVSIKNGTIIILCSMFFVGGITFGGISLFNYIKLKHIHHEKFTIAAIAQTCSNDECLKTVYLAELLDLSVDKPCNFYQFDVKNAQKRLESNPLIKSASIRKVPPKTIYVDYTLRKPIAFLGDYTNTAIDIDGFLFPFKPFFTPKQLPEICVGLNYFKSTFENSDSDTGCWGCPLQGARGNLALEIYKIVMQHCCKKSSTRLLRIDTSKACSLSYGQRQIVIMLEDRILRERGRQSVLYIYPKILRLSTSDTNQQLANYVTLNKKLLEESLNSTVKSEAKVIHMPATIIDLRIPSLAFITIST